MLRNARKCFFSRWLSRQDLDRGRIILTAGGDNSSLAEELYRCAVGVAGTLSGYLECRQRFFSQLEAEVEVRSRRRVELVQAAAAWGQGIESLLPI